MGTGINGAILLEFEIETVYMLRFVEKSVKGFLDNYDVQPKSERTRGLPLRCVLNESCGISPCRFAVGGVSFLVSQD